MIDGDGVDGRMHSHACIATHMESNAVCSECSHMFEKDKIGTAVS